METICIGPLRVIGKEGSTEIGEGFVAALWDDFNAHFEEIAPLLLTGVGPYLPGYYGLMTDFSRSFLPWEEDFTRGLYLAGAPCRADAAAPDGWSVWTLPAFRCLQVECTSPDTFRQTLRLLEQEHLPLAGAVQDYIDPRTWKDYLLFPLERLKEESI